MIPSKTLTELTHGLRVCRGIMIKTILDKVCPFMPPFNMIRISIPPQEKNQIRLVIDVFFSIIAYKLDWD